VNDRHRSTREGLGCAPSSGSIFGTPIGNRRSRPSVQARVTPRSSAKPSTKPMTERRLPDFEAGRTSYYPWAKADLLSRSRRIGRHRQAGCRGVSGRFSRICVRFDCSDSRWRGYQSPSAPVMSARAKRGQLAGCASGRRAQPGSNASDGSRVRPIAACRAALAVRPWYAPFVCRGTAPGVFGEADTPIWRTLESRARPIVPGPVSMSRMRYCHVGAPDFLSSRLDAARGIVACIGGGSAE
jgi:hypothetical protein